MYFNYIWLLWKLYLITDNYNYWSQLPHVCQQMKQAGKETFFLSREETQIYSIFKLKKDNSNIIHILTATKSLSRTLQHQLVFRF